jgi:periplasmic protein TonB
MTMATILPAAGKDSLKRWIFAASVVVLVHGIIVFWLMHVRATSLSGAPLAAIMIELAPVDIAPPSDIPPEASPGPQMTKADPEKGEPFQRMAVRELPPAPNPPVAVMTPPKPKPKKIVNETPKPVAKRVHDPPAPRTSAPRAAGASKAESSPAVIAAEAAAWRSAWSAAMNWNRHYPEAARARGEQGTVRLALTIDRGGHVVSARLIASSGSSILDQAALEMARHASGRALPPAMGSSVSLTVPVRYSIR